MTEISTLSELARFIDQSRLVSEDVAVRHAALATLARGLESPRPRRRVTDLLSAVLALSARTRRLVMPPVEVELDVFGPDGQRAVKLVLPRQERIAASR
jgi:hypothetical protein